MSIVILSLLLSPRSYGEEFQSTAKKTKLIELFTSEGCSSCPPADAYLSSLKKNQRLFKDFVPLAYHVTYWDYLGWKDPFADPKNSNRQRAYSKALGQESVYTPAFFVDGDTKTSPDLKPSSEKTGILTVKGSEQNWTVSFKPEQGKGPFVAHAALLGGGLSSSVKAGENGGRDFVHDFVVLQSGDVALTEKAGAWSGEFKWFKDMFHPKSRSLVVWITPANSHKSIQSAGGEIKFADK